MALKRVTNIHYKKHRTCLKCGTNLPKDLKDNSRIVCEYCKCEMIVDIHGNTLTLTAADHEYLRHRITPEEEKKQTENADPEVLKKLRKELSLAKKEAESWKEAAEGLARQIEEMNSR